MRFGGRYERGAWWLALALVLGCSDEAIEREGECLVAPCEEPSEGCAPGEVAVGTSCEPAGLPADMACAPGERDTASGCVAAGIPGDECAPGFAHNGERQCSPLLPDAVCPPGDMAVPGEATCRSVSTCGVGPFPDGAFDGHVDGAHVGGSDGSMTSPWTTVQAAVDAAAPGDRIAIARGIYSEDVVVDGKAIHLIGVCAREVEIAGAGGDAALSITDADGTTVSDLSVTGSSIGMLVSGSVEVMLDRLWLHDAGTRVLDVENTAGAASVTVRDSLLEDMVEPVTLLEVDTVFERSVIRPRNALAIADVGRGINAVGGSLSLHDSVVEHAVEVGLSATRAAVLIDASVIRDTAPTEGGEFGWGIFVRDDATGGSVLDMDRSVVEEFAGRGIGAVGSEVHLSHSVVRDGRAVGEGAQAIRVAVSLDTGRPSALTVEASSVELISGVGITVAGGSGELLGTRIHRVFGVPGWGALFATNPNDDTPTDVIVRESSVSQCSDVGISTSSATVTIENSAIVGTTTTQGRGLNLESFVDQPETTVTIRASRIANHVEHGVFAFGNNLVVERSQIEDILGRGMEIDEDRNNPRTTPASLFGVAIERAVGFGILSQGARISCDRCLIRDVAPDAEGRFGDGFIMMSDSIPGVATLTGTRVERSARAAIVSFGSAIELGDSHLVCQALDLNGEPFRGNEPSFTDSEHNLCGCPDADAACKLQTAALEAPAPLDPLD